MKRLLIICIFLLAISYLVPLGWKQLHKELIPSPEERQSITILTASGERSISVKEYICGVVAAEMPATFEKEALKAQAVAARSYAQYCIQSGKHGGMVCTSSGCCQAYMDKNALAERWGSAFYILSCRIENAVNDTSGEYLSYRGKPVQALFHASSYLCTQASSQVWSPVPYLISVTSPENAETVPGLISYVSLDDARLQALLWEKYPDITFPEDSETWIRELENDDAGRVKSVTIAGKKLSGREMRSIFSLHSTAFDISHENGEFIFTVRGHGHGVGMSQYGAELMALRGADHISILAHYYPGTILVVSGI